MKKINIMKIVIATMLVLTVIFGLVGCNTRKTNDTPSSTGSSGNAASTTNNTTTTAEVEKKNTSPIVVVWYPNESSNTHDDVRAEVARLIEQATGRKVENKTTTDYTIAIQSIASGAADIAMSMGATGYVEAKNQNPLIDVLFVNADKNGSIDEAKYFAWICVNLTDAEQYKDGSTYSIANIKNKKMSFVSSSSTSGFRVPTASIITYFKDDNLVEDDLLPDGDFFSEVYFGQSHQGSTINLINGNADVAAFCDIELDPYIQLKEGTDNTVGAIYAIKEGADAPFDVHVGKEFVVIACTPVFNGPNVYNPKNLSDEEVQSIRELFTSSEVADNELLFYDASIEGAFGLYKKGSSYGYVLTTDSWYDPYRN